MSGSVALYEARNGRPFERAPAKKRQPGQIVAKGRGAPITHSALVVVPVIVPKDEIITRARRASGNPKDLYGPPTRNVLEGASTHLGQLGLCRLAPGSTFRQAVTADTNVSFVVNMAGLSRDEPLAMPGILVNSRDNELLDGEDRATIMIQGINTIVHTANTPIGPGQAIMADPNPNLIEDGDGHVKSAVLIPGTPADHLHVHTRPLVSTTVDTVMAYYDNEVRIMLGANSAELGVKVNKSAEELFQFLRQKVQEMCDQRELSPDYPLRRYMLIQASWMYRQFGYLDLLDSSKSRQQRTKFRIVTNIVHRSCLMLVQQQEDAALAAYERTMPQTFVERGNDGNTNKHLLAGPDDYLRKLVVECKSPEELEEGEMRLGAHHQRLVRILYSLISSFLHRFVAGIALSSASKGGQLDVHLGGH